MLHREGEGYFLGGYKPDRYLTAWAVRTRIEEL
jgi:hypothetical protein